MRLRLSFPQVAMLRALEELSSADATTRALARRAGTNPGSASRTLRSLEDRRLARELIDGSWTLGSAFSQELIG